MCVGGSASTATLAGVSEPKDQLTTRVGRAPLCSTMPPQPPVKPHKTPTEGEDSVDNRAECLAHSDKHDHGRLLVCGNVNIAEEEGGRDVTEVLENEVLWEG